MNKEEKLLQEIKFLKEEIEILKKEIDNNRKRLIKIPSILFIKKQNGKWECQQCKSEVENVDIHEPHVNAGSFISR